MTSEVRSERIGVLIAVLSSTFGGTAAAVTRYVVGVIDPVTLAAFRFGIGIVVLLPLALMLRSVLPRGRDWIGAKVKQYSEVMRADFGAHVQRKKFLLK